MRRGARCALALLLGIAGSVSLFSSLDPASPDLLAWPGWSEAGANCIMRAGEARGCKLLARESLEEGGLTNRCLLHTLVIKVVPVAGEVTTKVTASPHGVALSLSLYIYLCVHIT